MKKEKRGRPRKFGAGSKKFDFEVNEAMKRKIEDVARTRFEGNRAGAIRYLISLGFQMYEVQ